MDVFVYGTLTEPERVADVDSRAGEVDEEAAVYVGDPARLGVADDVTWPAPAGDSDGDDAPFPARVRAYLREHDVRVRLQ